MSYICYVSHIVMLSAHLTTNIKQSIHIYQVIKDCVITVPSSFTQHERSALYTAADIADLKVRTCARMCVCVCVCMCVYLHVCVC